MLLSFSFPSDFQLLVSIQAPTFTCGAPGTFGGLGKIEYGFGRSLGRGLGVCYTQEGKETREEFEQWG